jgi:hypothetical protein
LDISSLTRWDIGAVESTQGHPAGTAAWAGPAAPTVANRPAEAVTSATARVREVLNLDDLFRDKCTVPPDIRRIVAAPVTRRAGPHRPAVISDHDDVGIARLLRIRRVHSRCG